MPRIAATARKIKVTTVLDTAAFADLRLPDGAPARSVGGDLGNIDILSGGPGSAIWVQLSMLSGSTASVMFDQNLANYGYTGFAGLEGG